MLGQTERAQGSLMRVDLRDEEILRRPSAAQLASGVPHFPSLPVMTLSAARRNCWAFSSSSTTKTTIGGSPSALYRPCDMPQAVTSASAVGSVRVAEKGASSSRSSSEQGGRRVGSESPSLSFSAPRRSGGGDQVVWPHQRRAACMATRRSASAHVEGRVRPAQCLSLLQEKPSSLLAFDEG
jgi:hypothetical protein